MLARILLVAAFVLVLFAAPATAAAAAVAGSAQVPEGSSFTLFALGLAGLIIGRRIAIKVKRDDAGDR